LVTCKFRISYFDPEKGESVEGECGERCESQAYTQCLFHDEHYLQDYQHREQHEKTIKERLMEKVKESIRNSKPLRCIGYYLPNDIGIEGNFTKVVDFSGSTFQTVNFTKAKFSAEVMFVEAKFRGKAIFSQTVFVGKANFNGAFFFDQALFFSTTFHGGAFFSETYFSQAVFQASRFHGEAYFPYSTFCKAVLFSEARFSKEAYFSEVMFSGEADFTAARFHGEAYFSGKFKQEGKLRLSYVIFEKGEEIIFDIADLSKVSFRNTDMTRVKFSEKVERNRQNNMILDEKELEDFAKGKGKDFRRDINIVNVKSVYRNLRENYEYRLRYDEAGEFFIREMELKRKYKITRSPQGLPEIKLNGWLRRNLSLTNLYYRLARYGEDLLRPSLFGIGIILLSTLYWAIQSNPTLEPLFSLDGLTQVGYGFERSTTVFLQLNNDDLVWQDYIIKALGIVSLGLFAIPMRRKFERKFRH
jgi:uncharacterized protein YjbI with pentapeptide repeats